jgi:hypothetical protein
MKTAQWTGAAVTLAVVVFVVTFLMNYLGSDAPQEGSRQAGPASPLEFAVRNYDMAPENEVGKPGHQDFWFRNSSGQAVELGLRAKSCSCTNVEVYVAPAPDPAQAASVAASRAAALMAATGPRHLAENLPLNLLILAACQHDKLLRDMEGRVEGPIPLTIGVENGRPETARTVQVRPGSYGWVRMLWDVDHPDHKPMGSELWQGGGAPDVRLGTVSNVIPAMEADGGVTAGVLNTSNLPRKINLYCWSCTRPSFHVKAEVVHQHGGPGDDPFVVGQPVALSAVELDQFGRKFGRSAKAGYRIPVTLEPVSPNGSQAFDLGTFQRFVELTSEDEGIRPAQVVVTGTVLGEVTVGRRGGPGTLQLGQFSSRRGKRDSITLESDEPGLKLELDERRLPGYLKAELSREPEEVGGHRLWRLEVRVLPGQAHGSFPRQDDPAYRDSAIYVKTVTPRPRFIRIPVVGTANED